MSICACGSKNKFPGTSRHFGTKMHQDYLKSIGWVPPIKAKCVICDHLHIQNEYRSFPDCCCECNEIYKYYNLTHKSQIPFGVIRYYEEQIQNEHYQCHPFRIRCIRDKIKMIQLKIEDV